MKRVNMFMSLVFLIALCIGIIPAVHADQDTARASNRDGGADTPIVATESFVATSYGASTRKAKETRGARASDAKEMKLRDAMRERGYG
jgi:hypothetical protein